jgi:hypothetical protein
MMHPYSFDSLEPHDLLAKSMYSVIISTGRFHSPLALTDARAPIGRWVLAAHTCAHSGDGRKTNTSSQSD